MPGQIDFEFLITRPAKIWSRLVAYALFEGRPLTTRGRWINPLVFALYRVWAVLPFKQRDRAPIFVMGVGRSGTTILGKIFAVHKDVGFLNEPKALWHAALGDDDIIGSYSASPGRYRMMRHDLTPRKQQRLRRFYSAYLAISGNSRIVDKYPELLFRTGLIDSVFSNGKKIVLLRNGMDICRSIENWSRQNEQKIDQHKDDWWGRDRRKWHTLVNELVATNSALAAKLPFIKNLTKHTDMAAVEWIISMHMALALQAENPRNTIFVRYEDLVAQPKVVLKAILRFCQLAEDPVMLEYGQKTLRERPPYNPVELSPDIQDIFDETMQSLGYLLPRAA